MVRFGYTLLTEQSAPQNLVSHATSAEQAGFDFEVISDHFSPWLTVQGHSPYAWSVLGAVSQVTDQVELMTFVTAPIIRYHPAVVAQKAATMGLLSDNRFILGLGAGENLNEHIVGNGWTPVNIRHEMLTEALEIISQLFNGGYTNYAGKHYRVDSAKLWDLPSRRVPIATAVSGNQSVQRFAGLSDAMVAVEPNPELVRQWDEASGVHSRKFGQIAVAWGKDERAAAERAREQFRWFTGGWKVNAELPGPPSFEAATQFVRTEDVAANIPCGPDADAIVASAEPFWKAGFTDIALVQVAVDDDPEGFFDFANKELLPALRDAAS